MEQTLLMPELQITQEYWLLKPPRVPRHAVKEFFESETYCQGPGSTVAKTTDGSLFSALSPGSVTAIAEWPISGKIPTGVVITSPKPTGTLSGGWPGTTG